MMLGRTDSLNLSFNEAVRKINDNFVHRAL